MSEKRKTRSDKNQIKMTGRDMFVLSWVADMYTVNFDTLAILLGREGRTREPLNIKSVYGVVRRWEKAGWVQKREIIPSKPNYVWLTKKGLDFVGLEYTEVTPSFGKIIHYEMVNQVRLILEELDGFQGWISERKYAFENSEKEVKVLPDGIAVVKGEHIGIEAQRSRARKDEFFKKFDFYKTRNGYVFDKVWFYCSPDANAVTRKALTDYVEEKEMGAEEAKKFLGNFVKLRHVFTKEEMGEMGVLRYGEDK